jgi:hypothetical protein
MCGRQKLGLSGTGFASKEQQQKLVVLRGVVGYQWIFLVKL